MDVVQPDDVVTEEAIVTRVIPVKGTSREGSVKKKFQVVARVTGDWCGQRGSRARTE